MTANSSNLTLPEQTLSQDNEPRTIGSDLFETSTVGSPSAQRPSQWYQIWFCYLNQPISGASLAVFRALFGLTMLLYSWQNGPFINVKYILPQINFPLVAGLHPLPGIGMYLVFSAIAFLSACVALGFCYRIATIALFATYSYTFLLDAAYYQNQSYLLLLVSFLFCFIPAGRALSVDSGLKTAQVPRWSNLVLRVQFLLVYFYGGLSLINHDWLFGSQPLAAILSEIHNPIVSGFVSQSWSVGLVAWGALALYLASGIFLLVPQTFLLGAVCVIALQLATFIVTPMALLPLLMLFSLSLFAAHDWPEQVLEATLARSGKTAKATSETTNARRAHSSKNGASILEIETKIISSQNAQAKTQTVVELGSNRAINYFVIALMHVYLLAQILIPLRHFLYSDNNVSWTERGQKFSWQMPLTRKEVKMFAISAIDPKNGRSLSVEQAEDALNPYQLAVMKTQPQMILRFVKFIADVVQPKIGARPVIKITALESLNGRPAQLLIDPTIDLSSVKDGGAESWIVPLQNDKARR